MSKRNWSDEEVAYIVVKKTQGNNFSSILKGLQRKWPDKFQTMHINTIVHKWTSLNKTSAHKYSQQEVDFVYAGMLNNFSDAKLIKAFMEQFNTKITVDNIEAIIRNRESTLLAHENKVEKQIAKAAKQIKKEVKNMNIKKGRWTASESKKLMACKNRQEVVALARTLRRSETSAYQKWYVARKALKEIETIKNTMETKKTKTTKPKKTKTTKPKKAKSTKKKTYTPRWTKEEDFDLLCNFYELSIDQARNRFNRSYGVIATRLEKLVDSTKPAHIEQLMEASKLIKSRKQAESKPTKMSRKERRKAKREAKIHKRMARLQSQLTEE